jgi:hypothetical protein
MRKMVLMIGLIMVMFALPVYAADVVNFVPGTTYQTTALTGFTTYGDMMNGMTVTATFSDGSSQTAIWATTGANAGAASGTDPWSLALSGDTWSSAWTLTNSRTDFVGLVSLAIDAGYGDSVFDIDWSPYPGTEGSADGNTFDRTSSNNFDVIATYSNLVALTGDAPVGDLYRNLSLSFVSPAGAPVGLFGSMTFKADTDNLLFSGDIVPTPEPATLLLLGFGLAGLATLRKKF